MNFPVYATPTCPLCKGHNFGIKEFDVHDANFRHFAILCTSCGCVVGTESMQEDDRKEQILRSLNDIKDMLQRHGIY